ncbi:MAG: hypothetical protein M1546_16155 [Chloroflexi bacterium]|nr:hypothetical protein [Chloroflexota bacterium]
MNNRGELGCALLLVVGLLALLVAGVAFVLTQAPWLLIAGPLALIAAVVGLVVLVDVFNDDLLMTSDEPGGFTAWRLAQINRLRAGLNKQPIWQVPKNRVTFEERQLVKQAVRLSAEIVSALRNSQALVSERASVKQQANDVPANMVKALWRLDRLRRVSRSIDMRTEEGRRNREEMTVMENQILAGMKHALDTLSTLPVSLMKVEMAQADRPAERLLTELSETNKQLRDVSAAYEEVRGTQVHGTDTSA